MTTIAIFMPDLRGGGAERVMLSLAKGFVARGHAVCFVVMEAEGELLAEAQALCEVVDLGVPRMRGLGGPLRRYLKRACPDVLIANMWPLTSIAVAVAPFAHRKTRVLVVDHSLLSLQYKPRGRLHRLVLRSTITLTYRFAHAAIGVSAGVAADMAQLGYMPPDRVHVIHNPVEFSGPPTAEALTQAEAFWQVPPGHRILTVGRFKAVKNHDLLLRAFAQMPGRDGAQLVLVGTGPLEAELKETAAKLGIASQLRFAGFQTAPEGFYKSADLFVLSSDVEGFGNVIVEAMAQGTSVVSTNCPTGPAEILQDGAYGTLVPVNDAAALAQAMAQALVRPREPRKLQQRAAKFHADVAVQNYLDFMAVPGSGTKHGKDQER